MVVPVRVANLKLVLVAVTEEHGRDGIRVALENLVGCSGGTRERSAAAKTAGREWAKTDHSCYKEGKARR